MATTSISVVAGALGLVQVDLTAARADLVILLALHSVGGLVTFIAPPISLADGKDHSLHQC